MTLTKFINKSPAKWWTRINWKSAKINALRGYENISIESVVSESIYTKGFGVVAIFNLSDNRKEKFHSDWIDIPKQ